MGLKGKTGFSETTMSFKSSNTHVRFQSKKKLLLLFILMMLLIGMPSPVNGWDCVCNPRECEALEPSGCPGLGVIVWDPCRCCKICARTLGEMCGGFSGTCEPGLKCLDGTCTSNTL